MHSRIKVLLSFSSYSVKNLSNLESSFWNSDTTWRNITPIIWTKTLRMVIYLSKIFHQTQSFFIVWNQKQMILVLGKTGSRERKLLKFKKSSKTFTQDTKPISNYINLLQHCHLFHFNPLIQTDSHQDEPLGYNVFPEPD